MPRPDRQRDPVPIVKEADWAPGPVWTGAEKLARAEIRFPDRLVRSKSLYRLSYPGPRILYKIPEITQGLSVSFPYPLLRKIAFKP
jgi:hypothetical protein